MSKHIGRDESKTPGRSWDHILAVYKVLAGISFRWSSALRTIYSVTNDMISPAKQKHGSDHELIIDQKVHSVTPRDPSEEEASLSENKLEDLVNDSAAFGGFIKQVVCAAVLLATGALFMWVRGERMTKRVRTTRPNYQLYFLPNDAATSKMD